MVNCLLIFSRLSLVICQLIEVHDSLMSFINFFSLLIRLRQLKWLLMLGAYFSCFIVFIIIPRVRERYSLRWFYFFGLSRTLWELRSCNKIDWLIRHLFDSSLLSWPISENKPELCTLPFPLLNKRFHINYYILFLLFLILEYFFFFIYAYIIAMLIL